MTRDERRRLLNADRKLAFGEELSALFVKWGYKRSGAYICIKPMEDGDKPAQFVLDGEGDLVNVHRMDWDDGMIIDRRMAYEAGVAKGYYDNKDDTEEEVEEKAEPEKAEPTLTLPLTDGQRVVVRDGRTGVIGPSPAADHLCRINFDDGKHRAVYRKNGRSHSERVETASDAVADVEPEPKAKPKRKANLTLPLTIGQKVRRRDGLIGEVIVASGDGDTMAVKYESEGSTWWHQISSGKFRGAYAEAKYPRHLVADA